ncbi:cobaltochelatase subunit CobN [Undibacterium sp. CY21W]|uniref:cobaltochelatase subunit CobN n=1 Tax=Undibacterium sp. CY21W TaxID=2762293 RepID=UPI00164B9264|nr:cobaltochelatase subunit CobN [Undibacterium sp. CY21W]MBC3929911.1 cobaltochelatase subunit CobN [Undibacterium sp. CY21W]
MTSATPSFFQRFFKPNLYQRKTSWVQRLYGLLVILISSACLLCTTAQAANVLIITSSPVPPGKFRMLAELASAHGVKIDTRYSEKLPASTDASIFNGYDIVMFDAPRDHIREAIQAQLHHALSGLKKPSLWLHTSEPVWKNLPEPLAKRLNTYYVNGSTPNYQHFFETLSAYLAGRSWKQIAEPILFPKSAIYHPRAPGLVFANAAAYLKWKQVDPTQHRPVIAIAMHQQYVVAEQTAFVNDMIYRIEAAGAIPIAFYSPVMDADAIGSMIAPGGKPIADVLINTQIMLNPEGRKQEFETLGIPVIQAMPYRKGDIADWKKDPHGIALMDVPFYMAQAEYAGVSDIQIAAATDKKNDQIVPIAEQTSAVVAKAINLAKLKNMRHADKKIAIFFWNYPPGEKNLSASYLNLPKSLDATLTALKLAGYKTDTPSDRELTRQLQRLLAPFYRPPADNRELNALIDDGLADLMPLENYREWINSLPAEVSAGILKDWGAPEKSTMVVERQGRKYFAIPRLQIGNVILMPQAPRSERGSDKEKLLYHSNVVAPPPFYLASYLWMRQQFGAHALIHYGTHGTQEWLPGKERGLSVYDYPQLAIGDVPVIYPYIVDNIGEALQTKRRGRAVTISHQTPPFAPAGLHETLTHIHDLLHAWLAQDEGMVKQKQQAELISLVKKERLDKDMNWDVQQISNNFAGFINVLHDHLHELARTAQPMGLHTFGKGAAEEWRLGTVMLMLGKSFWEAAAAPGDDIDETLVNDYRKLSSSSAYQLLKQHIIDGKPDDKLSPKLREAIEKGRQWYNDLAATSETAGLLAALDGRYIPTSYGGDPIKNPESLPTGRNLYPFDPSRIPTKAAWEAGKETMENLITTHIRQSGHAPKKLTFSLWSVETMRHQGMLEAQALWGLGVEPVWDQGGRVVDVKLVSRAELKRPRVDVVLSATGLYRDHFPNTMKILAKAAKLAAEANEADNPVAINARNINEQLVKQGWATAAADKASKTRIFASESGKYGTGLDDAALATDTWDSKAEGDKKLAQLYLNRMQYAYGPDEADWGKSATELSNGKPGNLYATHLKGTEGAILSRTSNLYGMLTTDDPFQYLGGIALAVRHLDGRAPELYISNLRESGSGKIEGAAQFLAKELATRNFHPGYIKGLMAEGYAGTLQVLDSMNNFAGWTSVAREIVRDDQWQEFVDVYVRDKHQLGLKDWFERENPHALAQTIARMLEAARGGYWQADAATVSELKQRYRELAQTYDVKTDNAKLAAYAGLSGLGLDAPASAKTNHQETAAANAAKTPRATQTITKPKPDTETKPAATTQTISGMKLESVSQKVVETLGQLMIAAIALLILFPLIGAWRQWRKSTSS